MSKKEKKKYTLKLTESELFAVCGAVNDKIHGPDPFGLIDSLEKAALFGAIRKADHAIQEAHGQRVQR